MIAPRANRHHDRVLRVVGVVLIVLAVGACSSAAKRRWLEALFDEPPSKRAAQAEEERVRPAVSPRETRQQAAERRRKALRPFPEQGSAHGPYAANLCQACHRGRGDGSAPTDSLGLSLARLRYPKTELCTSCHLLRELRDVAAEPAARLHGPVAAGRCTACHGAHASKERFLLLKAPGALCIQCHGASRGEDHPEVSPDECLDCHSPHVVGDFGS